MSRTSRFGALRGIWFVFTRVGVRSHRRKLLRTTLTVAGCSVGVALLFASYLLDTSLRRSIAQTATGPGGSADLVVRVGFGPVTKRDVRIARSTPGVQAAVPLLQASTQLKTGSELQRVVVLGVRANYANLFPNLDQRTAAQVSAAGAGRKVLMGPSLAAEPNGNPPLLERPGGGFRRLGHSEELAGTSLDALNGGAFVVMNLEQAAAKLSASSQAVAIYLTLESGAGSRARQALERYLGPRGSVISPREQARAYEATFESLAQITETSAGAALLIALFIVFTTMSVALKERRRELSLLSALGATRPQLGLSFLAEAGALSGIAATLGIAVGFGISSALLDQVTDSYPFLPIQASQGLHLTPSLVALTFLLTIPVSLMGAALPIREALRSPLLANPSALGADTSSPGHTRFWLAAIACAASGGTVLLLAGPISGWLKNAILAAALLAAGTALLTGVAKGAMLIAERALPRIVGGWLVLAIRPLARTRRRTAATIGALGFSTALAVGMGAALGSYESGVSGIFKNRYGAPIYVTAGSFSGITSDQPLPPRAIRVLGEVVGVRATYPMRILPVIIRDRQALIVSAPMVRQAHDGFSNAIADTQGTTRAALTKGLREGGVVLSRFSAARHGLEIGMRLDLPTAPKAVEVVGLYDDVLSIDAMYVERSTYAELSGDRSADRIGIAGRPGLPASVLEQRLDRAIKRHGIPAVVESRSEVVDGALANVHRNFALSRVLQLVVIVLASLVVATMTITAVIERRWEFALCRALGMSRRQIHASVSVSALLVGAIAAVIAVPLGLGLGTLVFDTARSNLEWGFGFQPDALTIGMVLLLAVLGAFAASLPAARIASKNSLADEVKDL